MVVSKYSSRKCLLEQFLKCRGQRRFILTLSGVLTDYGCQKLGIYEGCMSARARNVPSEIFHNHREGPYKDILLVESTC